MIKRLLLFITIAGLICGEIYLQIQNQSISFTHFAVQYWYIHITTLILIYACFFMMIKSSDKSGTF